MNINKITNHFLKLYRENRPIMIWCNDENYIILDEVQAFLLNKDEMQLNPLLFKKVNRLKEIWESALTANIKLEYKVSKNKYNSLINKYSSKDGEVTVYIDNKLLRFFNIYEIELYGNGKLKPVVIKEKDKVVAITLPMRILEEF